MAGFSVSFILFLLISLVHDGAGYGIPNTQKRLFDSAFHRRGRNF